MDFRLDFVNILLADLELEAEIEDFNEGAEMFIIPLFGKVMSKDGEGDEQGPHRPRRRREI